MKSGKRGGMNRERERVKEVAPTKRKDSRRKTLDEKTLSPFRQVRELFRCTTLGEEANRRSCAQAAT